VIMLVPADTPLTRPTLLTVATAGVSETHGAVVAAVADPANWVVAVPQTERIPVMVGRAFTVTVAVLVQPRLLVKVITLVPAATPVTRPASLTVAIAGDADFHGLFSAAMAEPVS
jgi:hypothetical protein